VADGFARGASPAVGVDGSVLAPGPDPELLLPTVRRDDKNPFKVDDDDSSLTTRQGSLLPEPDYCAMSSERVVGGAKGTPALSENRLAVGLFSGWFPPVCATRVAAVRALASD